MNVSVQNASVTLLLHVKNYIYRRLFTAVSLEEKYDFIPCSLVVLNNRRLILSGLFCSVYEIVINAFQGVFALGSGQSSFGGMALASFAFT